MNERTNKRTNEHTNGRTDKRKGENYIPRRHKCRGYNKIYYKLKVSYLFSSIR